MGRPVAAIKQDSRPQPLLFHLSPDLILPRTAHCRNSCWVALRNTTYVLNRVPAGNIIIGSGVPVISPALLTDTLDVLVTLVTLLLLSTTRKGICAEYPFGGIL